MKKWHVRGLLSVVLSLVLMFAFMPSLVFATGEDDDNSGGLIDIVDPVPEDPPETPPVNDDPDSADPPGEAPIVPSPNPEELPVTPPPGEGADPVTPPAAPPVARVTNPTFSGLSPTASTSVPERTVTSVPALAADPQLVVKASPDNDAALLPISTISIPAVHTPLAGSAGEWALNNLILAGFSFICGCVLAINGLRDRHHKPSNRGRNRNEDAVQNSSKRAQVWRSVGIIVGMFSPVIFVLTEDVSHTMTYVDVWTSLMAMITLIQLALIVSLWIVDKPKKEDESSEHEVSA
jgi:hypothetical protein